MTSARSAYPLPASVLAERVRELTDELGALPSQRRVMRECKVGQDRAATALATVKRELSETVRTDRLTIVPDAAETQAESVQEHTEERPDTKPETAPDDTAKPVSEGPEIGVEPLVSDAAGTPEGARRPRVPRWPLLIIALGAFVSIWGGWVGLGEMAGFGPVRLLPGIADSLVINSAITLPLGVEAYAAYAMSVWLAPAAAQVSDTGRRFACWSSIAALGLGVFGQATYHLLVTSGATRAPGPVVIFVSCLPVLVLGAGAALAHLSHRTDEVNR
jgi:hypothetical protein